MVENKVELMKFQPKWIQILQELEREVRKEKRKTTKSGDSNGK